VSHHCYSFVAVATAAAVLDIAIVDCIVAAIIVQIYYLAGIGFQISSIPSFDCHLIAVVCHYC